MQLLDLDDGGLSLEFVEAEWPAIHTALAVLGPVRFEEQVTFDYVFVADEKFILANDWDEPCLISMTEAGAAMLRWVASAPSLVLAEAA